MDIFPAKQKIFYFYDAPMNQLCLYAPLFHSHIDPVFSIVNLMRATDNFRLKARWDTNGDGLWETDFSIKKQFAYKFPENGVYKVICELMDDNGNVSRVSENIQIAPILRDSVFTDNRNDKTYSAVFLFDRWW